MSTRIIVEKDGERYVANDLTVRLIDGDRWLCVENKISNCYVASTFTKLTPVIRTDNSAKCDCKDCSFRGMELCEHRKLMEENAKLRKEYDNEHLSKLKVVQHEGELITANYELHEENAKLREALKPIIEFDYTYTKWISIDEMYHASFDAVREAQSIMK